MADDTILALAPDDPRYPPLLREIHEPPNPLFVRGGLPNPARLVVAVVGSRRASSYGRQAVERIVEPLAARGVVIVSGLAFGIDAAAHEATLKVGGTTLAVLGSPVTHITPPSHHQLGERIVGQGGALISEVPTGGYVGRENFAVRNRIIAGLVHATIVVEAAFKSGSLITARLALAENRDVFAVPGPITSDTSQGTNNLLKLGARPITEANDLLVALNQAPLPTLQATPQTTIDRHPILRHLSPADPIHVDTLAQSVTISLPELQSELTLLEIRGQVRMTQPGYYIRV